MEDKYKKINNKNIITKEENKNKSLSLLINEYNILKSSDIIESKNIYNEKMKKDLNINYSLTYWFWYALIVFVMALFMGVDEPIIFLGVLFIMVVIPYVIYIGGQKLRIKLIKEEQEKAIKNYEQILKKYKINSPHEYIMKNEELMNAIIDRYNKLKLKYELTGTDNLLYFSNNLCHFIDFSLKNNILKIYETKSNSMLIDKFRTTYIGENNQCEYGFSFKLKNDYLKEEDFNIEEIMDINLSDILYFNKIGKIENNTIVSGGGGTIGGSNLSGAIVGGIIAGGTGAIIGSRKEGIINNIKTEIKSTDKRKTLLKLKNEEIFFNISTYDVLLKLIPNKDYEAQIINGNKNSIEEKESKDIIEKIEKLKNLLDTGALTKEEFENQKKKLLL